MQFDIENINSGEWFTFFGSTLKEDGEIEYHDPEPDAGKVCLRQADIEIVDRIGKETKGKKCNDFTLNPKTRKMEHVVWYDQTPEQAKKEREMLWDYSIVAWEGIKDKNGKDIPCTLENKLKLMSIPVFMRFANRCWQIIAGQAEALEKNS